MAGLPPPTPSLRHESSRGRGLQGLGNILGLLFAWAAIFLAFYWIKGDTWGSWRNVETLVRQTAIVSMGAIGMTYVIIAGGIDLSIGSLVALVTVVIADALQRGFDPALALVMGVAAGALGGLLNGLLVTSLRVGPFIVTLGTLGIFRGISKGLAHEQKIDAPMSWLNELLAKQAWIPFSMGVWLTLLLAALMALVLRATVFGRHVYAVGGNEEAARYSGLPVRRVQALVFVIGGLFAGLAGLLLFSRLTVGDPTVAVGLELDVIAAVVIGGASLSGGQGSIAGSLLGAFIMATIRSGGSQCGWPNWVQEIVTGSIIIAAVTLDRLRMLRA